MFHKWFDYMVQNHTKEVPGLGTIEFSRARRNRRKSTSNVRIDYFELMGQVRKALPPPKKRERLSIDSKSMIDEVWKEMKAGGKS